MNMVLKSANWFNNMIYNLNIFNKNTVKWLRSGEEGKRIGRELKDWM